MQFLSLDEGDKESDNIEQWGKGIGKNDGSGGRLWLPDIGSDGVSGGAGAGARDCAAISVREDHDLDSGICCGVFLIG